MILNLLKTNKEPINDIEKLIESYKNLNIEQTVSIMRTKEIADEEIRATLQAQHYADADIELAMATKTSNVVKTQNIALTKTQTIGHYALATAVKVANVALTMMASAIISLTITKFIEWITKSKENIENLSEVAKEAKENVDKLNETFANQKKTVKEIGKEYAELAQGIDQLSGKNASLSTSDYERFLELSKQLGQTFPELIKGYDENETAILNLNGSVEDITTSLSNLLDVQQKLFNQKMSTNIDSIYNDYLNTIKETNKNIEEENKKQEVLLKARDIIQNSPRSYDAYDSRQKELTDSLELLGIDYRTENKNENGIYSINYIIDNFELFNDKYNALYEKTLNNIDVYNAELNAKQTAFQTSMSSLLNTDYDFTNKLNTDLQAGITELFRTFSPDNLPENINSEDFNEVYSYLKSTYLNPVIRLNDDIQTELIKIFNKPTDISNIEYIELVDKMQSYFDRNKININLDFIVEDEKDLQNRVDNAISSITKNRKADKNILTDFMSKEIDTADEYEFFLSVTKGVNGASDAIQRYTEAQKEAMTYPVSDNEEIFNSLDNIRSAYNTVSDAIEEYRENKHLSLETIEELLQLDDKYINILFDENGQLTLNKEAYDKLTQAKLNTLYVNIISDGLNQIKNLKSEEEIAHQLKLTNEELTDVNWDLFESEMALARASLAVEKNQGKQTTLREQELDKIFTNTQNQIALLKEAGKGIKFDDFYSGSSSSKSSKKEFSKEFDWIENSVENVNRNITNLNEALNNTTGFKDRLKAYDELIKADNELVKTTSKAASAYENEWIKASNKISKEYNNKIVSGNSFSIDTITNETTADNIEKAKNAYETWQSMLQQYNKALSQVDEDTKGKTQALLELEQTRLDILSIQDQETMSSIQKNTYIKEEESLKKNILKYNLLLAKSEEEKIKLQKEYNQYIKDNQDLIYKNNKEERDNKNSFYSSRIKDIQNAIDLSELKGNQGTESQYNAMNDYIGKQIELERQNYNAALIMRNSADYGTSKWEKYNQEIQTAQDNIYSLTQAQIENNRTILKLPIQAIDKQNEKLQDQLDILNKRKESIESAISAASNIVKNQIDTLNQEKETTTDYWDEQIDAINKQKEALTKSNEEIKNQLALEKAQYEFEKYKSQKSVKIYREGQGFVYESDQDALKDAKEELDNQEYNSALSTLDKQIETLEKSKEEAITAIDSQINSLELYKERIDSITTAYQQMLDLQQLISLFGTNADDAIMNGDLSIIDKMQDIYNDTISDAASIEKQIEANEKAIVQIEKYAEKWNGSSATIQKAKENIEKVVTDNAKEIESIKGRNDVVRTMIDTWTETKLKLEEELGFIKDNQIIAKDEEGIILGERLENIKKFAKEASNFLNQISSALVQAKNKKDEIDKLANEINSKTSNKSNNKAKSLSLNVDTMGQKHDGIKSGLAGEKDVNKQFKYIALSELKPDEVPTLLLKNEAVLTKLQQSTVLDNFRNSFISGINNGMNLSAIKPKTETINKNIEFNGDIILNNVNDPNSLAKSIKNEFLMRLDQEFYK